MKTAHHKGILLESAKNIRSGTMNYEYEIQNLKSQVSNLQDSLIQMARNNTPIVGKVDSTANQVDAITPYTDTKTAYIGDTEISFDNVPSGNLSIFGLLSRLYRVDRESDRVVITLFAPLEEVTEVTISIQ